MKLKLEAVRDISILIAEGPITPENFAVLRAGIKKLFKDGKNKIILELPDSDRLTPPILREFATLNLAASELAGSIVLAKIAPLTRAKIEAFSKPPSVRCFADRENAVQYFHPPGEEAAKPSDVAEAPAEPTALGTEEKKEYSKGEIRAQEMGDLGSIRKKLSDLEAENKELKGRLAELVVTRRDPPDLESWKEKVSLLEKQLAEAIENAQETSAAKK
jgi:hypothetical protein